MRAAVEAAQDRTLPGAWELVGKQLGRYELLHLLASGGMGAVFVGRARGAGGFERLVAIKVLHRNLAYEQEFVAMFLDEARLAAQIHHPNVVATLDVASDREHHYIVMEYVAGIHLGALAKLARRTLEPIPVPITARITLDVLAGLGASHSLKSADGTFLKLIHRDVSPVNILVGADGNTRLTDFGIAKAEARLSSTRKGEFKGKLAYAAPEHLSARDETDQRSDLFSMGVVLWEALANRRLFQGGDSASIVQQLMLEPIPLLSSVRLDLAPFDSVLERALMRNPSQRFASAAEMSAAVERAAAEYEYEGVASYRTVSGFVEKRAAKKLTTERAAIHKGRSSFTDLKAQPPATDDLLPPTQVSPPPTHVRRRLHFRKRWIFSAAIGLALLGTGSYLALAMWPKEPEPEASTTAQRRRGDAVTRSTPSQAHVGTAPEPVDRRGTDDSPDAVEAGHVTDGSQVAGARADAAVAADGAPNRAKSTPAPGRAAPRNQVRRPVRVTGSHPTAPPPPAPSNPYE